MKRMFIVVAACCLGACAAPPERASIDSATVASTTSAPAATQPLAPSRTDRVYLDDYDLLHVQAAPPKRQPLVLGKSKN